LPLKAGIYDLDIIAVSGGEVIDHWIPKKKFTVMDDLNSVLSDNWRGIISAPAKFSYVQETA
jgi:hypothetical protein